MRTGLIAAGLLLVACSNAPVEQEPSLAPPETGPFAFALFTAADQSKGWDVLEALDEELTANMRRRVQVRGLVSGAGAEMMVRFTGTCADGAEFMAGVRRAAAVRGVHEVRCAATLPTGS